MIQSVMIAHRNQDVSGARAHRFGSEFTLLGQIELVHFDVRRASHPSFGKRKPDEQQNREAAPSHGGNGFREQVDHRNDKQGKSDQAETHGNLHATKIKIKRHLKFALARIGLTEYQNSQPIHRETPNDAEGIQVGQKSHMTTTDDDGKKLQRHHDIDDPIAGPKLWMWLAKP